MNKLTIAITLASFIIGSTISALFVFITIENKNASEQIEQIYLDATTGLSLNIKLLELLHNNDKKMAVNTLESLLSTDLATIKGASNDVSRQLQQDQGVEAFALYKKYREQYSVEMSNAH